MNIRPWRVERSWIARADALADLVDASDWPTR
jgi:hypothetical protein